MEGSQKILASLLIPLLLLGPLLLFSCLGAKTSGTRFVVSVNSNGSLNDSLLNIRDRNNNNKMEVDVLRESPRGDEHNEAPTSVDKAPPLALERCANGRCAVPSLPLLLLHVSILSYSSVTKTTMSLLQVDTYTSSHSTLFPCWAFLFISLM
jgi:hypothetical protein